MLKALKYNHHFVITLFKFFNMKFLYSLLVAIIFFACNNKTTTESNHTVQPTTTVQPIANDANTTTTKASSAIPAVEISLPDVNGKTVTLSSFKGKYVLVDFWASWCKPCRMENPNVVAAFKKYGNKNFTILGVSLDKDKTAWQNAIKDDKLTWTQISDLKYWYSQAAKDYGVESIPTNFLIDPQGNVVGRDLHGADLDTKLTELLK